MDIRDLIPSHILDITPYQPGKPVEEVEREFGITGSIKLASNENPLGPSPKAVEAMKILLQRGPLYPAPYYHLFDAYRVKYRRGRLRWGNRGPLQTLKRWLGYRQVERLGLGAWHRQCRRGRRRFDRLVRPDRDACGDRCD